MADQQVKINKRGNESNDTNGVFQGIVVKLNSDLSVAWSQDYGLNSGADQIFDLVVDRLFRWILA